MAQFTDQTLTARVFELDAILGGTVTIDGISVVATDSAPVIFNKANLTNATIVIPSTAVVIGDLIVA